MKYGLNVGSGKDRRRGIPGEIEWINVDADPATEPDVCGSVEYLGEYFRQNQPLRDKFDLIIANDILEHVPYNENDKDRWKKCLADWVSCLRPGGLITIQVPDMCAIVERLKAGDISEETANRVIYGESTNLLDRHYQLFSKQRLAQVMKDLGLEITAMDTLHVCAIVKGRKPE